MKEEKDKTWKYYIKDWLNKYFGCRFKLDIYEQFFLDISSEEYLHNK